MSMTTASFPRSVHIQTPASTQVQQVQIEKLRALLSERSQQYDDNAAEWLDDVVLSRFLIARAWDIKKAFEMVEYTLKWRRQRNPARYLSHMSKDDEGRLSHEACTGKIYISGHDAYGRVVIVFDNSCQNTSSHDDQLEYLGFILELGVLAAKEADKYVIFINLTRFSLFNCPPMHTTKETVSMLTVCFAECLGHLILYNPPSVFYVVVSTLKYMIDAKTFSKFVVLSDKSIAGGEGATLMHDVLGENWRRLTNAGQKTLVKGISPNYVHSIYWPQTLRLVESLKPLFHTENFPTLSPSLSSPDGDCNREGRVCTSMSSSFSPAAVATVVPVGTQESVDLSYFEVFCSLFLAICIACLIYP